MKKILGTLLVVVALLCWAQLSLAVESSGNRIMFLIQPDRDKATLENDAELIWGVVKNAKANDCVELMTLSGQKVFSIQVDKRKNPLESKRDKNIAGNAIRQFFTEHSSSPRKQNKNDVAGAIKRAIGRFNAEYPKERYVLVMLTSGLYKDRFVDFSNGFPSDSWIVHQWSPYSSIPKNATGKMMDVVFVTQNGDYQTSYQAQRLERFYSLLFSMKKTELVGFTDDHQTASELIRHSTPLSKPVPQPEGLNGPLILFKPNGQKQVIERTNQPKQSSLNIRPESYVACSVLMRKVDKGLASVWVSIDLKKKPVRYQSNDFRVYEIVGNEERLIPSDDIVVQSERPPLAVVLVRDVSPSMSKIALQQSNDAIYTFVDMLGENDKVGLVSFSTTARTSRKLTDNKDKLKKSVKNPLIRLGGTSLYDAIILALTCVQKDKGECLRVVVTFTDGEDNLSKSSVLDVVAAAKAASTPIFLVGVGSVDVPVLQSIAKGTGGMYFPANDAGAMKGIYEGISRLFTNSLVISYRTSAKNAAQVDVAVADK